jgi:hypothetical protein
MGLAAGHRAGIVHRDVKPRNIFLIDDPDGGWEVKVLDFGIADAVDARATTVPGGRPAPHTPRYAAPEQLRGEQATAASDVYSLGLTALEMLCGEPPVAMRGAVDDGPASRMLATLCAADPALRPAIADVLRRAVHPHPTRRFADAGQLLRALEPALGMPHATVALPTEPGASPSPETEATSPHPDLDATVLLEERPPPRPLPSAVTAGLARPAPSPAAAAPKGKRVPVVRIAIALMLLVVIGPLLAVTVRDGVQGLRGTSHVVAARQSATESAEVAREEYDRVTRMHYTAGARLEFQAAGFPWGREEDARAVVSAFRSRRVPAGVGSHDVYPPLVLDSVYALVGPLRKALSPEERALLDELEAGYGVTFVPLSLTARQPE